MNIPAKQNCLNCGESLPEEASYCPACGQKVLQDKDFSFRHFFIDAVGDYFHVDGKFFASLKLLLFKPGRLTVNYLLGKRQSYIHPFRLFLFISLVYFILISLTSSSHLAVDSQWDGRQAPDTASGHLAAHSDKDLNLRFTLGDRNLPMDSAKRVIDSIGMEAFVQSLYANPTWFQRLFARKIIESALVGPQAFINKLIHHASKVIFFLIPFIALIMKLLYLRKKRLYYHHLIFSLHFHACLFLLLILVQLFSLFLTVPLWLIILLIMCYLLLSMKIVYGQSWAWTGLKFLALLMLYMTLAIPLFGMLLLAVSTLV